MTLHALIVAAGRGTRTNLPIPKQYAELYGVPLLIHVLSVFEKHARIANIHLVLAKDDKHWATLQIPHYAKLRIHYQGGLNRADTVRHGLELMQVATDDWVLVHDAARPGINLTLLDRLINALQDDMVGGILALPLVDTLKLADREQRVERTLPRGQLWQAQTPQMFRYGLLKQALHCFPSVPNDEAEAVEALGFKPKLVLGDSCNLKVTTAQDLITLEALLHGETFAR